ncbi:MAG: hypothetical protein G01um101420_962 [Parcubacteria group bacterium Gr01-1014_20]|nr:MAG: hypothetical protein G01um101420_962 [Parcubacteria group bacterium Gr01-1014_20]
MITLGLWPFGLVWADVATSTTFNLHSVMGTGGGLGTSTSFSQKWVIGQPAQGISSSTIFVLKAGFLYFGAAVTTTPATSVTPGGGTPSGGVTVSGGGGPAATGTRVRPPRVIRCDDLALERVDLSGDCKIDLVDLSILLFYYDERGRAIASYDFNENNQVDFPDISIMMFYWTG